MHCAKTRIGFSANWPLAVCEIAGSSLRDRTWERSGRIFVVCIANGASQRLTRTEANVRFRLVGSLITDWPLAAVLEPQRFDEGQSPSALCHTQNCRLTNLPELVGV